MKDVKIIKELPRRDGKIWTPYTMRVPRKCSAKCYQSRVLPNLLKKRVSNLQCQYIGGYDQILTYPFRLRYFSISCFYALLFIVSRFECEHQ